MSRPFIVMFSLLTGFAACTVAAQDPATCYENGEVDPALTAQWQAALAAQDPGLMARLAGNWSNEMTAFIDDVLNRTQFTQSLAADGQQITRSVSCPVGVETLCNVRETTGTWAASQNSDGTISMATREGDGSRAGYCILKDLDLQGSNQLFFANTGGLFLTRN